MEEGQWGRCKRENEVTGKLDGCQQFDPSETNKKKCDCCGCHQNFHEKPAVSVRAVSGARGPVITEGFCKTSPATLSGWSSKSAVKRESEDCVVESPVKKVKQEVTPDVKPSDSLEIKGEGVSSDAERVPAKLQKNWDALVEAYPHAEYGEYSLFRNKERTWMVKCELCASKKPGGYDTGPNLTLSNFKNQHFKSSLHKAKLKDWMEGKSNAEAKAQKLKEEQRAKREELIKTWAEKGAQLVNDDAWQCNVCGYHGTFTGARDTIKAHMHGKEHAAAVSKASTGPAPKQATLQAAFASAVASGKAEYPPNYIPQPGDIPRHKIRPFLEKNRCHGWFQEHVLIGGVQHSVRPLLLDLPSETGSTLWYADSVHQRPVAPPASLESGKGTFWHVECEGFQCSKCSLIPSLPDFQKRLVRETEAQVKRGDRVCLQGVNLKHLQRSELIATADTWRDRWKQTDAERYWLNIRLLKLSKSTEDLACRLQRALASGSLPEIAEFFKRAYDSGAFEGKNTLLHFLLDLGKNLLTVHAHDGSGSGKRHSKESKLVYECLLQFGGPLAHNFVSLNLLGPSINTSKVLFRKDALLYVGLLQESTFEHVAKLLHEIKTAKGITGLVPLEVSEDESACIALATWNRRTDCIDGFCGKKATPDAPHVCTFDCNPSAGDYESILTTFQTMTVGTMCSVVALNPLVAGLPTLILGLLPICNTFTHQAIQERWDLVRSFLSTHFAELGVLISHASDGDRRRVKCMLQSIGRGTFGLNRPGFIMPAEVISGYPVLMDQDAFHIGKKLRNVILAASRNVFWGPCLATINHVSLVMTYFSKDQHGLLEEDVNVKDKQNVPAVQRLAAPKVRVCLEMLQAGTTLSDGTFKQENVLGTLLHLQVIYSFLQIFYGKDSLRYKVVLASFIVHIVYMGAEYIRNRGLNHSLKKNWLTREGQMDLLISCHFVVNLIRVMRDHFSHLPVCLEKAGSDCVENIVSLMGQWVRNKHNFTFGEALERISHISRLEQIKVDESAPLFATSRRRKLFWLEITGCAGSPHANMQDYASVAEPALSEAWDEGLSLARERAEAVGMLDVLQDAGRWDAPWPSSFSESMAMAEELLLDSELDASELPATSSRPFAQQISPADQTRGADETSSSQTDDGLMAEATVRAAILDAMQEAGEPHADTQPDPGASQLRSKVSPSVVVPEKGLVYKMRLISELNANPGHLPLDRLRRVQAGTQQSVAGPSSYEPLFFEDAVGLFDDVAILLAAEYDVERWYLARIQKIFKLTSSGGRVAYHNPVSIGEGARDPGVRLILKYYKALDSTRLIYQYGGYEDEGEADPMPLDAVICRVKLAHDSAALGQYRLEQQDLSALTTFVERENQARGRPRAPRQTRLTEHPTVSHVVASERPETTEVVTRTGRRATRVVNRR